MGFSYWKKFMIRQLSTSWQYLVWVSNIYHQHQLTDYYKVISLSWGVFIHISLLSKPSKIKLKSKKNMITSTNRTHAKSDLSAADFLEGSHLKSSDNCSAAWGWFFFTECQRRLNQIAKSTTHFYKGIASQNVKTIESINISSSRFSKDAPLLSLISLCIVRFWTVDQTKQATGLFHCRNSDMLQ